MLNRGVLRGLRVLDLGSAVAAPYCAQVLADHGADVIKVEPITGDVLRVIPPFATGEDGIKHGSSFHNVNRNKRSIAIDLTKAEGRALLMDLVEQADALIENFRTGVMDRLGLGYEVLRARNPRLVYTAIRGFGDPRSGANRYVDWPCVDVVAQAFSGVMSITGENAQSPMMAGGVIGDTVPGLCGALGSVLALWHAQKTGEGQFVDIAMTDTLLAISSANVISYGFTGEVQPATGSRLPTVTPFGKLEAKDGAIMLAAPPGRFWAEVCALIGKPELAQDPRFATPQDRNRNEAEVYAILEDFTRQHDKADLVTLFGGKIPVAPIYSGDEVFAEPYFRDREMLTDIAQEGVGALTVVGLPVKLSQTPGAVRHRAPALAEHTAEVMREFGIDMARVESLRAAGVLGGA